MAEWRECELRHDERTTRFGRVKADCDLGIGDERGIGPSICAECPVPDDRRDAKKWRECGAALVEAVRAAQPIVECEEARHDILLKCTQVEGATEEEKRLREKHLRGKRREAYRARKAIDAAFDALDRAGEEARDA